MYTLGIDIGSTSSKAAILQDGKMIVGRSVVSLGTKRVITVRYGLHHCYRLWPDEL